MSLCEPINGFTGYLACSDGYILSARTGKEIYGTKKQSGYREATIRDPDGNKKTVLVHRIIAAAFCEMPQTTDPIEVNHIDGDKDNNRADNLEWVTHNENLKHAYETGLRRQDVSARRVTATSMETGEQIEFESIYKAARFLGISQGNICMACRGERPHAGGYLWRYGGNDNE